MIFPRTVAMAAPAAPWFNPKIKIGSKMIFTMEPIIDPAIDWTANPSVLRILLGTMLKMIDTAPNRNPCVVGIGILVCIFANS